MTQLEDPVLQAIGQDRPRPNGRIAIQRYPPQDIAEVRRIRPVRITITEGSSAVGEALISRVAAGGLFGSTRPVSLSLLGDLSAQTTLESQASSLEDCAFPLLSEVRVNRDPRAALAGTDWIIVLDGQASSSESDRIERARVNAPQLRDLGRAINISAPWARILVASHPSHLNCMIARSHAPDVPAENWFASTRLTQNRAAALLAAKAHVPVECVSRMTVWGNDSEIAYADVDHARIGHRAASRVIGDRTWLHDDFEAALAQRYRDTQLSDGTSASTAHAEAILATIRSITMPTLFGRRFEAAVVSDRSYGVPRGLVFGFPLRTNDGRNWSIVRGLVHDDYAQKRIAANIVELEREIWAVSDLIRGVRSFEIELP
jgi:malate dehydrogenase